MVTERIIPLTIGLPKPYRDLLRRLVLEANMKNPDRTVTVSEMGREIVVEHLKKILEERKGVSTDDTDNR